MMSCRAPRLPLAGFKHSEVTSLSFASSSLLITKVFVDSDLVGKDRDAGSLTGFSERAFARE